jgi:predicted metal-dependent phosphoesterase TrpH
VAATIDLHLHTTASDGRHSPDEVVRRAHERGLRVISITDHDTREGVAPGQAAAARLGLTCIPGIEITSVMNGRDVHVLAYNLPPVVPALDGLLAAQRRSRLERACEIARRLERMGTPIDIAPLVASTERGGGKALARPQIAQCLIAAGHASSVPDAFDRFLGEDSPAYVPHTGASPADVVGLVVCAGGVASLAHPGPLGRDELIPGLRDAGLSAIEAYHSAHDEPTQARYAALAKQLGLAVTGGSDYHGEGTRRSEFFGVVGLPPAAYAELQALFYDAAGVGGVGEVPR